MKISEVYNSTELKKLLVEETTSWSSTITYVWVAEYPRIAYSNDKWYRSSADTASKIWRIKKIVESNWTTETFYPNWDNWFSFAWDDRASLTYL